MSEKKIGLVILGTAIVGGLIIVYYANKQKQPTETPTEAPQNNVEQKKIYNTLNETNPNNIIFYNADWLYYPMQNRTQQFNNSTYRNTTGF